MKFSVELLPIWQGHQPKFTCPLVTDIAADGVPVAVTCRLFNSAQGCYWWSASPVTEGDWGDAHLINAALDIHADDPAFIPDELPERGIAAG